MQSAPAAAPFAPRSAALAILVRGLKIPVSVVRFRPQAPGHPSSNIAARQAPLAGPLAPRTGLDPQGVDILIETRAATFAASPLTTGVNTPACVVRLGDGPLVSGLG